MSADTIVPGYGNPQNLNRYTYVLNNPLLYTDPTGHMACSDAYEFCGQMTFDGNVTVSILRRALRKYNVKLKGNWDIKHAASVYHSVGTVGAKFASERGGGESASEAFRAVYDHMTIQWEGGAGMCGNVVAAGGGCTDGAHQIRFWSMSGQTQNDLPRMVKNVIHELGHAYDWTHYNPNDRTRASNHMSPDFTRNMVLRPNEYAGRPDWQQSAETTSSEIFALPICSSPGHIMLGIPALTP